MKKSILFALLSIFLLTSCHYLWGLAIYTASTNKYCNFCSCDPNNKERKEFEDCDNDRKYNKNGEYLCCPNCMLVCKQKPRWW